jgi:hypothetical protein
LPGASRLMDEKKHALKTPDAPQSNASIEIGESVKPTPAA